MSHEALAKRLFDAIEAADVAALEDIFAPGATIRVNVNGRTIDARALARALPAMKRRMPDRRYADRRYLDCAEGFVHLHRITGTRRDGATVAMAVCAIVAVAEGRIAAIEEYCDGRQLEAVFG